MIGWETDVLEPLIRESATGDILCLSKAVTKRKENFIYQTKSIFNVNVRTK